MAENSSTKKQKIIQKFFSAMCSTWITQRDRAKCTRSKDIVALVGSLVISILASLHLFVGAFIIALVTIIIYIGLQYVLKTIDENEADMIKNLESKIEELNESAQQNKKMYQSEKAYSRYLASLCAETTLLARAIRKANTTKTAKSLYPKLTNSIIEMLITCLGIEKDNFAVHIYVYDGLSGGVRRVDVESYVKSKQAADENHASLINDPEVAKHYYAKAILSRKTFFALPSTEEIRKNLYFRVNDEELISQHTQYAAMVYDVGSRVKIYIEVLSYNGLCFGKNKEELISFIKKVIAPFSSILSLVDWNTIRRDCNAS